MSALTWTQATPGAGAHVVRHASEQPPLEYVYALGAATAMLAGAAAPLVLCRAPELCASSEVEGHTAPRAHDVALWVEPLAATWAADLAHLAGGLAPGGRLVVIASLPLARFLPGWRAPQAEALGMRPAGLLRLRQALGRAGLQVEALYGLHTPLAASLSLLGRALERWGRPDLGDRLVAAARLRYAASGPLAYLGTVALLTATRSAP